MSHQKPCLVTFSGIDGAGKTTQIELLSAYLTQRGYRVKTVTFWDDVAVLANLRARISLRAFRKTRQRSLTRCDKNVRKWYLTVIRWAFYLLDAASLRQSIQRLRDSPIDFVIFDRYVYDQAAQVRSHHWPASWFLRCLIALAPRPDYGLILDAVPDLAFVRKPEYPLDFMYEYRRSFVRLRAFEPRLRLIAPGSVEAVREEILACLMKPEGLPPVAARTLGSPRLSDVP